MTAKIKDVLTNLTRIAAKASKEEQPLVASLARETLSMAEVLQKIVEGNAASRPAGNSSNHAPSRGR